MLITRFSSDRQAKIPSLRYALSGAIFYIITGILSPLHAESMTAGSPPSSSPSTFLDTKTGTIEGFMPDIARDIAKRENITINFTAMPFSTLIQSVLAGKIDMIVAAMTPTDERKKHIDFSQDIISYGDGIFVRDDNKKAYHSFQDFKGEVIGTMSGTDYAEKVIKSGLAKEVKLYDNLADLVRDVQLGRITLGMSDYPIIKQRQLSGGLKGMHAVDSYTPIAVAPVAFGVRKGNDTILKKINDGLTAMKSDGSLEKLKVKWGMPLK